MPSGPILPTELYRDIMQHVGRRDLCILSRTSRELQPDAEFFIYQRIESSRRPQTTKFCSLITKNTRLHTLVRILRISNEEEPGGAEHEYWEEIAGLIGCLTHLEELRIYDNLENGNAWILNRCISRLSKIGCDFVMDADLSAFLRSQVGLHQIDWTDGSTDLPSDRVKKWIPEGSQVAPSVTLLSTNSPTFALRLLSSSSLTHLWICGPCAPPAEEDGWLHFLEQFRSIGNLRSLRLNLPHRRRYLVRVLDHLTKYAFNLRSLGFLPWFSAKVRIALGQEHPHVCPETIVGLIQDQEMFSLLAGFKKLHSLVTWNVITADTSKKLAECCSSLRLVACLHYSYSHEYVFLPVNPMGIPHAVHDPEYKLWKDA